MSPTTLYHVPRTISSPIVQCLHELDLVDNEVIDVKELSFVDLKSDEHKAINPMGTSPTFQDTKYGIIMWESGAVLDYILDRYDPNNTLSPPAVGTAGDCGDSDSSRVEVDKVKKRAKYLQLKQYILATVYPSLAALFIHTLQPKERQDPSYVQTVKDKWQRLMRPILAQWLGDGPYFLGEEISAIDLLVAKPLSNAWALGLLDVEDKDSRALSELYERVASRPSYRLAYESSTKTKPSPAASKPSMPIAVEENAVAMKKKGNNRDEDNNKDTKMMSLKKENSGMTQSTTTSSSTDASNSNLTDAVIVFRPNASRKSNSWRKKRGEKKEDNATPSPTKDHNRRKANRSSHSSRPIPSEADNSDKEQHRLSAPTTAQLAKRLGPLSGRWFSPRAGGLTAH